MRRSLFRSGLRRPLFLAAIACCLAGCREEAGIETYPAPRTDVLVSPLVEESRPLPAAAPATGSDAMLVAMVPVEDHTWFFKASCKAAALDIHKEELSSFLASVEFDSGEPRWELPEGWSEEAGDSFRFATLRAGEGDEEIEVAVSQLATTVPDLGRWELMNVNRWRALLGQPELTQDQMNEQKGIFRREVGGYPALFAIMTGSSGGGSGTPPFAAGAGQGTAQEADGESESAPPPSDTASSRRGTPSFTVPEGWEEGQTSQMRVAAFQVIEGEQRVEITLFQFPPSSLVANVNRWRGELGLPEIGADEVAASMQTIEIDEVKAPYFEFIGPADAQRRETTLAAIAEHGGSHWFFKLRGDSELAAQEKTHFEEFLRSVQFE